ncbi:similar to Saccharomyces cerevisiae YKL081W TEF4 Gamma subunit of translational elongation factor eEF1B [Maudiozyma barnettii]|nr:similar to Saccharomyces cerevisiae YKL081W TEF4 Gamma subunit of translational elongation factor eEF1B [Kazachstania barnettii]
MSQGTLYTSTTPRCHPVKALIEKFNLDIACVEKSTVADFETKFPLGQIPAFIGPKGFKITEEVAILYYVADLIQDEKAKAALKGKTEAEKTQVLRWVSVGNTNLFSAIFTNLLSIQGVLQYNKKENDNRFAVIEKYAKVFDDRLKTHTYIATEKISLGDLQCAVPWTAAFSTILGPEAKAQHPYLTRWLKTVVASDFGKIVFKDFKFAEKALAYVPAKKEKKDKPKKDEQPKKKDAKKEEQPAAEPTVKKAKHPLEALGKSTFVLDDWKRKYSNEDTRPVALPWFWEHYNPEEYSIWKVGYKYNDELTLTFMSNNLVGGFFNRLSASTKYMFGCMVIYGENNNNGITGAIMIRGQEFAPAFDVAPDWESYAYAKLDPTKEEDKEFINNMWAWDKPVVVDGENREIADGKVLK